MHLHPLHLTACALQTVATLVTSGLYLNSGVPLGFHDLATSWRHSKTEVDVLSCLRLIVFNRRCDPGSKLGVLRWLETVALPAGSGVVYEHRHLLRAMDVLDEYSDKLSTRLARLIRVPSPCGLRCEPLGGGPAGLMHLPTVG